MRFLKSTEAKGNDPCFYELFQGRQREKPKKPDHLTKMTDLLFSTFANFQIAKPIATEDNLAEAVLGRV